MSIYIWKLWMASMLVCSCFFQFQCLKWHSVQVGSWRSIENATRRLGSLVWRGASLRFWRIFPIVNLKIYKKKTTSCQAIKLNELNWSVHITHSHAARARLHHQTHCHVWMWVNWYQMLFCHINVSWNVTNARFTNENWSKRRQLEWQPQIRRRNKEII